MNILLRAKAKKDLLHLRSFATKMNEFFVEEIGCFDGLFRNDRVHGLDGLRGG